MEDYLSIFFKILKCGATGQIDLPETKLSDETFKRLYDLSKAHDLAHIVGYVLKKANLLDTKTEIGKTFDKEIMMALYRYTTQTYDLQKICGILEGAKIRFITLKGERIRAFYPEPWLRTSCDIDVLIEEKNLKSALDTFLANDYKKEFEGFHDICLRYKQTSTLELHFCVSTGYEKMDNVLNKIWDYSNPVEDGSYRHKNTNEFFFLHFIAHVAYHINRGGCGIKQVLDFWLLKNKLQFDKNKLDELLEQAGLTKFYQGMTELTNVLFENAEPTTLTNQMLNYILTGGTYGTTTNFATVNKVKTQKNFKYYLKRLFPGYSYMKQRNPSLKKLPFLLPVFWVVRIVSTLFDKCIIERKKHKTKKTSKSSKKTKITQQNIDSMSSMLTSLGLLDLSD